LLPLSSKNSSRQRPRHRLGNEAAHIAKIGHGELTAPPRLLTVANLSCGEVTSAVWTRPKRVVARDVFEVIKPIAHPDYVRDRPFLRQYFAGFEPSLVARANRVAPDQFDTTSKGRCTTYVDEAGNGYEIVTTQWMESVVRVDLNTGIVTKTIGTSYAHFGIWEREIAWLDKLRHTGIAPELIEVTPDLIATRYAGEPVSEYTLPFDWREQADHLLEVLAIHDCRHNDIAAANIVVADGKLRLIDFAWASPFGLPVPAHWPEDLGRHRMGKHDLDDRRELYAALSEKEEISRALAAAQQQDLKPPAPAAPPRQ
jgi:hypothetical protein